MVTYNDNEIMIKIMINNDNNIKDVQKLLCKTSFQF